MCKTLNASPQCIHINASTPCSRWLCVKCLIMHFIDRTSGNVTLPEQTCTAHTVEDVVQPGTQCEAVTQSPAPSDAVREILLGMYDDIEDTQNGDDMAVEVAATPPAPPKKRKRTAAGKAREGIEEELHDVNKRLQKETDDHEYFALSLCPTMRRVTDPTELFSMRMDIMQAIRKYL